MMPDRYVHESASEYSELAMPNDANPLGTLFGGKVMHLVDLAGSLAAGRHARRPVVTASVDYMNFLHPVHIGQLVVLKSSVNRAFHTSMEVGVRVCVEDLVTGEIRHTSSAYMTFVALGEDGRPAQVPGLIPCGAIEERRYREAEMRRQLRLAMKNKFRE